MKSRDELLDIVTNKMLLNQINVYEKIHERLECAASNGRTSVRVHSDSGRDITQTTLAVVERLKNEGFYVRCGWEGAGGGLTKNFIEVSLLPFKKENRNIKDVTLLCAIVIPVILIILFYLYVNV